MGCASSSLPFRDVYTDLQRYWSIEPQSYGLLDANGVRSRSRLFASCASVPARHASKKLRLRNDRFFVCDPLFTEQDSLAKLALFSGSAPRAGRHPYNFVLFTRLATSVSSEHLLDSPKDKPSIENSDCLVARWDFRLWMLACCEFYHVLAILQEQKALPAATKKFMKLLVSYSKKLNLFQQGNEDGGLQSTKVELVWQKGAATQLTSSTLTPSVLEQLRIQMPSLFACIANEADSRAISDEASSTASNFISAARKYEKRVLSALERRGINPLASSDSAAASTSVSLLVFAEWAALHYALSFCGEEEDLASYGVILESSSPPRMSPLPPTPLPSSLPSPSLSPMLPQNDPRQLWRVVLVELRAVEREIAKLEQAGDRSEVYESLSAEREMLRKELDAFVAQWLGGREVRSAEDFAKVTWGLLETENLLPNEAVHQVLARKAFDASVGASGVLEFTPEVCRCLGCYVALLDLYCDVRASQEELSNRECLNGVAPSVRRIDGEVLRKAFASAQSRFDMCPDSVAPETGSQFPLTRSLAMDVLQQLFDLVSEDDAGGEVDDVDYVAESTLAVHRKTHRNATEHPYRPIEELREAIGVAVKKQQDAFAAKFLQCLDALCEGTSSICNAQLASKAIETTSQLSDYTSYSSDIAKLVCRYVSVRPHSWSDFAGDGGAVTSAAIREWYHRLRSESLDYLSLIENPYQIDIFVRTLFCFAAGYRGFEEIVWKSQSLGSEMDSSTSVSLSEATRSDFISAVKVICGKLACSAEVLLHDAAKLLNLECGVQSSVTRRASSAFTLEDSFTVFHRAFLASRTDEKSTSNAVGELDEKCTVPLISILQVIFVMAHNYTRVRGSAYWQVTHDSQGELELSFSRIEEASDGNLPRWKGEQALLALARAMPLRSFARCHRLFAQLTDCHWRNTTSVVEGGGISAAFLHMFYEHFRPYFKRLGVEEKDAAEAGTLALECVMNRCSCNNRDDSALGITCRGFSSFLQFILGYWMTKTAFESVVQPLSEANNMSCEDPGEILLSEHDLLRLLDCFGRFTHGGKAAVPTVKDAHLWLQSNIADSTFGGFISLPNAHLWYGFYRAEHYSRECLYDWWIGTFAQRIPYTVSSQHRLERQSTMRRILRVKQHRENLPESFAVEALEDEDGYLPTEIISAVLEERWSMDDLTKRVFTKDEDSVTTDSLHAVASSSEGTAPAPVVPAWLSTCIGKCNSVLYRSDLASREVHHSDFRFLLEYVHHFVSAYISLYYATVLLDALSFSESADGCLVHIPKPAHENQAKLKELFSQNLLPLTTPSPAVFADFTSALASVASETFQSMRSTGEVLETTCRRGAHNIASILVSRTHFISCRARQAYLDEMEAQDLREIFTSQDSFFGAMGSYVASVKFSYWKRLRLLLPFGPSLRHRQRRRELFTRMDHRQRGYLTMNDIARGLTDMVQLQTFRSDFTPALLRAFRATKDVAGENKNIVYVTRHTEEQVLMPWELDAFLTYLYRYLELYFMFDVLTCGGHVHPETLHVVQKQQQYDVDSDREPADGFIVGEEEGTGEASISAATADTRCPSESSIAVSCPRGAALSLYKASLRHYQLVLDASPMKKEVSLEQFQIAQPLFRRWGSHVEDTLEVFQQLSRPHDETGKIFFDAFAIWASERDLRPEGYGYGYDDAADALASMEEEYAAE